MEKIIKIADRLSKIKNNESLFKEQLKREANKLSYLTRIELFIELLERESKDLEIDICHN